MKIVGQRELMIIVGFLVFIAAGLLGETPANVEGWISRIAVPLGALITAVAMFAGIVNKKVENGEMKPSNILDILTKRETWYTLAIILFGGAQSAGLIKVGDSERQIMTDLVINGGMMFGLLMLKNFSTRATGAVPDTFAAQLLAAPKEIPKYNPAEADRN